LQKLEELVASLNAGESGEPSLEGAGGAEGSEAMGPEEGMSEAA
jgi:hypothetical protein